MGDRISDTAVGATIEAIYDASLAPDAWPAVLERLAALFQCHFADIFTRSQDRSAYRGLAFGLDRADYQEQFLDTWFKRNVWGLTKPVRDAGEVLSTRQMVDITVLKRSEIFTDYLDRRDLHEGLRLAISADDTGIQDISLLRAWSIGPFEPAEIALGRRLLPHLQRATAIARRLDFAETASRAGLAALEAAGFAVFVFDRTGAPVRLNQAAERLVRERDGLSIERSRLAGATPTVTRQLNEAIGRGTRQDGVARVAGSLRLPRPSGAAPLTLVTVPLRPDADWVSIGQPALLALVGDPKVPSPTAGQFAALFGLTEAEADLAAQLLAGHDLRDIAARSGRSIHTLRNHLARLMGKTDTTRQSELMLLLRGIPQEITIAGPAG